MNHGGIEALLIQDLMHNLMMQKLLHLTRWTLNAKNPWLLVNHLVAIQPGISTTGQPRRFQIVGDMVLRYLIADKTKNPQQSADRICSPFQGLALALFFARMNAPSRRFSLSESPKRGIHGDSGHQTPEGFLAQLQHLALQFRR